MAGGGGFTHERTTVLGETDEWLTPRWILDALGPFDLDPCSPQVRPWPTATRHYTTNDDGLDGLSQPWAGMVWLNPPYGRYAYEWVQRLAEHGQGIALIPARTETVGFQRWVWDEGTSLLFLAGRVTFHRVDGSAGAAAPAPSVLVAYGSEAARRLKFSSITGAYVTRWEMDRG